jgi:threonine dehydrogenase-like Zn-dependent dehydrogenase
MKAIVKTGAIPGTYKVMDRPVPKVRAGEVLINIKATGLCYTDVSILNGLYKGRKPVPDPVILGHEGAGIIAELGAAVNGLSVGDRVAFEPLGGCGICHNCRTGNKNMCSDWNHVGITDDGTFAEYMVIPAKQIHLLPDSIDFADAALLEPLGLVARSIEHVRPQVGETAVIIGPGTVGLLHLQVLKASGVTRIIVIGLESDKIRFEIAKELGATHIVNASTEDPVEAVLEITKGLGADILVETASSPKVWDYMLDLVASKGRLSCFGLYPEAKFQPLKVIRSGITIYGDVAFLERHFIQAINWLETGKVSGQALVTKRFSLDEAELAFEAFRAKDTVKCLFEI